MHLGKIAAGVLLGFAIASSAQAVELNTIAIAQTGPTTGFSPLSLGETYGLQLAFVANSGTGGFANNAAAPITITQALKLQAGETFAFTSSLGNFTGQVLGGADAPALRTASSGSRVVSGFILGTFTSLVPGVNTGAADFTFSLTQTLGTGAISVTATLDPPQAVPTPEPVSLSLMGLGLLGLGAARRLPK